MTQKLKIFNGRKIVIFLLGLYSLIRGIAYLPFSGEPKDFPRAIEMLIEVLPIEFWAGVWLAVGIVCIIKTFTKEEGIAIPLAVGMMMGWGTAYLYSWLEAILWLDIPSRSWFTASAYMIPAMVIALLSVRGSSGDKIAIVIEENK